MDGSVGSSGSQALRNQAFIAESLDRVKAWIAPLNITDKRMPMFFAFPITLDAACYVRLAEARGDDQPVYAFQVPSKERKPALATSISDIARRLVAELEKTYPKGDFILGGWSAGAIIALEMAQQLTRKNRPPAVLVPIDHAPLNAGVGINPSYPSLLNDAIRLRVLWRKSSDEKWKGFVPPFFMAVAKTISSRIAKLSSHAQRNLRNLRSGNLPIARHPIQKPLDDAKSPDLRELLKKLYTLLIEYKPRKYDGPVLLFLSADQPDFEYDRKWSAFAPNMKVCHFLGTPEDPTVHDSFIRGGHVDSFARTLKEEVDLLLRRRGDGRRVLLPHGNCEDAFRSDSIEQPSF